MLNAKTEAEFAVYHAVDLLVNRRANIGVSEQHLLALCLAAPGYAVRTIKRNRPYLILDIGDCAREIAHIVRSVEWQLLGTSTYLADYLGGASAETAFVQEKIHVTPDDFTLEDLRAIVNTNVPSLGTLRDDARTLIGKHVASFAEKLTSEPPGLSGDVAGLRKSIQSYGFNPDLDAILTKIDEQLELQADEFDQLATIRNIRSFFEALHGSIGRELQRRKPKLADKTPLGKCGLAIDYLHRKGVTTEKFTELAKCLYSILSDGDYGVHALKATRDYTRLCRNMVVEYAVTLFLELERRLAEPDGE